MSCLEHWCSDCNYVWFDNRQHASCLRCCSSNVHTWWDEDESEHDEEVDE